MRLLSSVFQILVATTALVHAQNDIVSDVSASTSVPTAARILGEIPDGTPPPPAAPRPEYKVAANDILDTATHPQGGRTITLRQIKPIALPPPPAETAVTAPDADFSRRLAGYRAAHPKTSLIFLGATVYRTQAGPPRTLVRWWPRAGNEPVTFWSSADFALIAGGIQSFADSAGTVHSLMMGWGNLDLDRPKPHSATPVPAPLIPDFPAGPATFQIVGNPPDAGELTVIQSLHDLYNNGHARLLTAYQGREQARVEREAHLKAHPPQPKDITLNYWRTEKPAATEKGDAR